jgi:predicted  nucleic acid-binding Zn-ribbon protein
MTRKNTDSPPSREGVGIATLVEAAADGGRVLYIGDGVGLERLAHHAERVLHLQIGEGPAEKLANVQRRKFKAGRIAFRPGSFDLVIAPDLTAIPGDVEDVILDLAEIADAGVLAVGVPFEGRDAYEDFVDLVDELLDVPRIFGLGEFHGVRVSELGEADDDLVVSSLEDPRAPAHVFAVAGAYDAIPASVLVEIVGRAAGSAPTVDALEELEEALAEARERAAEVEALERELGAERARVDELGAKEKSLEEQVARLEREARKLGEKLDREKARVASFEEVSAERRALESRLEARGEELRELRVEVDRRGVIVRDLVEELRELRRRGTGGSEQARERVLRAEARAEASALEVDELRARVLELEDDLAASRAAVPGEGETPEARDEARNELPEEIRAALGERDGLALRVAHLEAALAAARSSRPVGRPVDDRLEQLQAELMETRAGAEATRHALEAQGDLVRRLQRDLASTEVGLRAAEERADHDVGEIARLRDALLEAVTQADRAAADAEAARAELEKLRAGQDALRANEAAALESAEAARIALVEAKAALMELEARSTGSHEG